MANDRSGGLGERERRLAEALRANLKRRKDQARGRRAAETAADAVNSAQSEASSGPDRDD